MKRIAIIERQLGIYGIHQFTTGPLALVPRSLATLEPRAHGFAPPPHDGFAFSRTKRNR
jgi:hypothetical protein